MAPEDARQQAAATIWVSDKRLLVGTALGEAARVTAARFGKRDYLMWRLRKKLRQLLDFGSLTSVIVYLINEGRFDVATLADPRHYPAELTERWTRVIQALSANPLTPEQCGYLAKQAPGYPRLVEPTWASDHRPAIVRSIMDQAGLELQEVNGPYMMVLAAAATLGQIHWFSLAGGSATSGGQVILRLKGGFTISVSGPPGGNLSGRLNGQTIAVTIPSGS